MACIVNGADRGRPGRWLVDWTDARGIRRVKTYHTREAADRRLALALLEGPRADGIDPRTPFGAVAELYLQTRAGSQGVLTREKNLNSLEVHILPTFGDLPLEKVSRLRIELWVNALRKERGLGEVTVIGHIRLLSGILSWAAKHGGITGSNPAQGIVRDLGLRAWDRTRMRALTDAQMQAVLRASRAHQSLDTYERLMLLAHTGASYSEACGIQWDDVDLDRHRLVIRRQVGRAGDVSAKLKTEARAGEIEIPAILSAAMRARLARLREDAFALGRPLGPWVLHHHWPEQGTDRREYFASYMRLRNALRQALRLAGFEPNAVTLHGMRHSYISSLLAAGVSPATVQRQARHSTITMTVDRYGSHIPHDRPTEIDRRAERTSPGMVGE